MENITVTQKVETVDAYVFPISRIVSQLPGPKVTILTGLHGGEYPSIVAGQRLVNLLQDSLKQGEIIIVHGVNQTAFWARTQGITPEDGLNLNRCFPGKANGSFTERLAYEIYERYMKDSDYVFDCHSGDLFETLMPYVYVPYTEDAKKAEHMMELAKTLDVSYIVKSTATTGAYNYAALQGKCALLLERGCNGQCNESDVQAYICDLQSLLQAVGVIPGTVQNPSQEPTILSKVTYTMGRESIYWHPQVKVGQQVVKGQLLGFGTDHFGREIELITADHDGVVLYYTSTLAAGIDDVLVAYGEIE